MNRPAPSLDQWVESNGFASLREQWLCHFKAFDHDQADAERLARLCMISLRDQIFMRSHPSNLEPKPRRASRR